MDCNQCEYKGKCSPEDCVDGDNFYPRKPKKPASKAKRRAGLDWWYGGGKKRAKTSDEFLDRLEYNRKFWEV